MAENQFGNYESSDEFDDWEYEEYEDDELLDDDQTADVTCCPHCGGEVYEEAQQCPHCGEYIVVDTHPFAGRSWWWIALGLLGVAATVFWLAFSRAW
jgi:hypothetical protein